MHTNGYATLGILMMLSLPVGAGESWLRVPVTITSELPEPNVPVDPEVDGGRWTREAGVTGTPDWSTLSVWDRVKGRQVPHAIHDAHQDGLRVRVEWVVREPAAREYELRVRVGAAENARPKSPAVPSAVPWIGNGDLLRYNAGAPRPIVVPISPLLVDLTGDGRADLAGCWNYAYRPGDPWNGVIAYPRRDGWLFGDLARIRANKAAAGGAQDFADTYASADFADFNRDGQPDLAYAPRGARKVELLLHSGKQDAAGMPLFVPGTSVDVDGWEHCRAVDLDADGAVDLVVDGWFVRNRQPAGWPFDAATPVRLDAGRGSCFLDVDGDGRLDAICLQGGETVQPHGYRIVWRRNEGGDRPRFGGEQPAEGIGSGWCTSVTAFHDQGQDGVLVQHDVYQSISAFGLAERTAGGPRFRRLGRAQSLSAVMSLSDQAWPSACDWDDDGDLDLLVGGGYGWPRIVINDGTREAPAFAEPRWLEANGEPIRLTRNQLLGEPANWHDMGYPFPEFADWDGDGLKDLLLPNETNRLYWHRNVGERGAPRFGPRQQLICEGYPDSAALREQSARGANDRQSNNGVYPYEPAQPFFWRTGAAFADWNGDGLLDFVTHDGLTRQATLWTQYRTEGGLRKLRRSSALTLVDGRVIDDRIVARRAHWTESFRAADWDRDGRLDLFYSVAGAHAGTQDNGSIYLLRNAGTPERPQFEPPRTLCCFGEPIRITNHGPHPWVGDLDGDSRVDLLACVEWSVYPFYRHAALVMDRRPELEWGAAEQTREE